jgi:chemotaxis protein CheX
MAILWAGSLDWIGRLDSAVSEVFEMMLERSCVPIQDADIVHDPISAQIFFSGAVCGECLLFTSRTVAHVTAGVLLGEDSGPDSSMVEDAVGELCNMVAGGWKSKLGSAEAACAISPPKVSTDPISSFLPTSDKHFRRFYSFEGCIFGVQMAFCD